MFKAPSDIAFNMFGFPIYFYGIILAFAVFIGIITTYKLFKKFYNEQEAEKFIDFSPILIITGIAGARLYYCAVNYSYYINHPLEIFAIRQGGLSIHGMLIAGLLTLLLLCRFYKISFLKLSDAILCATALAQSIGRWGNFFNSEAFGTPCNLPWKLFIPLAQRPSDYINYEYFHPTFLYESILDFGIFILLLLLFKRFSKAPGTICCLYLILYGLVRIFVEHFRIDSALNISGIPVAQIVSLVILAVGICGLIIKKFLVK